LNDLVKCPGCGLRLVSQGLPRDERFNASGECRAACDELSIYTLSLSDSNFIHQHFVDAYAAQHGSVKPIGTAFALAGLCLAIERGYSGRQVQQAHVVMAAGNPSKEWPRFELPPSLGPLTISHVAASQPGPSRDQAIDEWARSVWEAWNSSHVLVSKFVDRYLV
jgi:uncharacterized protein DUF5946